MTLAPVARFAPRAIVLIAAALVAAAVALQPAPIARLGARLVDAPLALGAGRAIFDGTLVVDIASGELAEEAARSGLIPYRRETFGQIVHFLSAAGARTVAFNLVMNDAQAGDDGFAARLTRSVVLGASGSRIFANPEETADIAAVEGIAPLSGTSIDTAIDWPAFRLPAPQLVVAQRARIGVIHYEADADGVVRRQPLLHSGVGVTLPSLPLAVIGADNALGGRIEARGGEVRMGLLAWPVDARGQVLLRFPTNARELPTLSFHRLALAASGARADAELERAVRGRAVFIGNSRPAAGFVAQTPIGPMPGLHLAAIAHAQLVAGAVATPSRLAFNAPLIALALAPGVLLLARRRKQPALALFGTAGAAALIAIGGGVALGLMGVASAWPFAAIAGVLAALGAPAWHAFESGNVRRHKRHQRLAQEESNRLKTEFLNHLTHELRTPLTAIMGFNKINQFTDELGKDQRIANSAVIARNCEHLLSLINNNLDLAKMEAGQLAIVRSPEDPEQIFRDLIATMRALAADKHIELRYLKRTRLPEALLLDASRLRQVLINLMGNAVKFTSRGSVELAVAWHVAALEIEIRDTGPGIAQDAIDRIWQPFRQADLTIGRRFGGTGLGLAISKRLVDLMGGEISVESKVGIGTTFRVRLPSEAVAKRPVPNDPVASPVPAARERLSGRVLLVDDNEDLRALVGLLLRNLGLEVATVENGLLAVDAAMTAPVDVILMDMEMPVMNGFEAVHVLRTRGYTGTIFGLTAHQDGPEVARAILSGCDAVLTKPVNSEGLKEALVPVLARSRGADPSKVRTLPRTAKNG